MQTNSRDFSYGQNRRLSWLEKIAVARRLSFAIQELACLKGDSRSKLDVVEIGCGFHASNLRYLSQRYPEYRFTGVDLQVSKDAQVDGSLELIEADQFSWCAGPDFNMVLSLAVAEHLLEPQQHFELIAKSLSKNGVAVLTSPTPLAHMVLYILTRLRIFDRKECDDHKLYLTEAGIRSMAEKAGLKIKKFSYFQLGLNQVAVLERPLEN